ncbi:hypothetical protein KEM56_000702 [Ascosphaera pollenicola]|nr:hypothetical protein KEM56_000702 [Ascosphaera pollenicola]
MKLLNFSTAAFGLSIAGAGLAAAASTGDTDFKTQCLQFEPEKYLNNVTRTKLEYTKPGDNVSFPTYAESCGGSAPEVIEHEACRIGLIIPTSNRSSIRFEAWFPSNWTGRFLASGNSGIGGCIQYGDLTYGSSKGFATVGSNNGHDGMTAVDMLNNPDVITDFAYRALHTETVSGKTLAKNFYGKSHNKAYYISCSTGGRQGLAMAERYPEDFDGIVAGSPAADFNHLLAWSAKFYTILGASNSSDFIAANTWTYLIHDEVLNQCDGLDGVMDGIITDPTLCQFRPETLMCSEEDMKNKKYQSSSSANATCLTPKQVGMVDQVFSPMYGADGELKYPAMQPGSEETASVMMYNGEPFSYSTNWWKYAVYNTTNWDPATFNLSDITAADEINPGGIQTWPKTFDGFKSAGGKMISYHGQQDSAISSFNTARLYDHISRSMGLQYSELEDFWRFFRIPGMGHCGSGPGASVFGQSSSNSPEVPWTPERNIYATIIAWVENGTAPDTITGTKFVDEDASKGVEYTRKHCRYPLRSTYVGNGTDASAESAWKCLPAGSN